MLDDFRQHAYFEDEEETSEDFDQPDARQPFLGLSPIQRFLLAFILLLMTVLLSSFCLLVTGRIVPPFL